MGASGQTPALDATPAEQNRIQRLQLLGELWATLAFHHPFLAHEPIDWDQALTEAIGPVELARSSEEVVDAFNRVLFSRLGDPLSYARTRRQADFLPESYPRSFDARLLGPGVGYLSAPDPAQYLNEGFAEIVRAAVERLGPVDLLVVDLRWRAKQIPRFSSEWLGLWVDSTTMTGPAVSVLRFGPGQSAGWRTEAPAILQNLGVSINTPTVFLTNLTSYPALEPQLDALQLRSDVAVVLEAAGPLPESWAVLTLDGDVRVRIQSPMLISKAGTLGSRPDLVSDSVVDLSDAEWFRSVLRESASSPHPAIRPFDYRIHRPVWDTASMRRLTREERLAGLIKVWTLIGNFQAYLDYAGIEWSRILPDWIPRAEAVQSTRDYYLTLRELSSRLNDSHVVVHHPSVSEPPWSIPALLMRIQDKVLVVKLDTAQLPNAGLSVGDEIIAVDGKPILEVESDWRSLRPASSPGSFFRNVWEFGFAVRGERDTPVRLTVDDGDGERRHVTLLRTTQWLTMFRDAPFFYGIARVLPGNIGYMSPYAIPDQATFDSAFAAVRGTRGMILDLRQRAGPDLSSGYNVGVSLLNAFVEQPVTQRKGRTPVLSMHHSPPSRAWTEKSMVHVPHRDAGEERFTCPIVVLTNARQQSAGEEVLLVLKAAERFTFVGSPTTGTNGGSPRFQLPAGGAMSFTIERVENNDGTRFHGIGIVPDVLVAPTVAGIRAGQDEVLQAGLEVLEKLLAASSRH